jgi:hypothetical protein
MVLRAQLIQQATDAVEGQKVLVRFARLFRHRQPYDRISCRIPSDDVSGDGKVEDGA